MPEKPVVSVPPALPQATPSLFRRTLRTVVALMLREMTTTYGRSPGGYLWALLEPIGGIAILTLVISSGLKLRQPSLGISFAMFYATGILIFLLYIRMQQKVSQAIVYSRPLLHYPTVTFIDTIVARVLLTLITQVIVLFIVMGGMTILFETRTILDPLAIAYSIGMATTLAMGIGTLNALLMPMFPVYASIWSILTTPLFFISGILYTFEELPLFGQQIIWFNPLIHVTAMMRKGFYGQYDATFASPTYVFGLSAVLFAVGFILLARNYRNIVDRSY